MNGDNKDNNNQKQEKKEIEKTNNFLQNNKLTIKQKMYLLFIL